MSEVPGPKGEGESPPADLDALESECDVEFIRAGGPGGQHRNKTETGVRVTHLPTGIRVTATERRSQYQNRRAALERLMVILEERAKPVRPRRPTRKPKGIRKSEIESKRRRGSLKRERRGTWD